MFLAAINPSQYATIKHDNRIISVISAAIKTGRYTTSKHTNDTLELKRLKFKTMLERRSKSQGLFSRALASCPLSQGFIYENMRKNMETKDPCQSADSGVCCNQDRISFRYFSKQVSS